MRSGGSRAFARRISPSRAGSGPRGTTACRNRLHLDREGRLGFFAPRSNVVANLETCEIVSKALLARLPAIRDHLRAFGPLEGELWTLEDREGKTLLGELRLGKRAIGLQISLKVKERGRGPFDGFRVVDAGGRVAAFATGRRLSRSLRAARSFDVSVSSFFQGNLYLLDAFLEEIRTALRAVLRREEGTGADGEPRLVARVSWISTRALDS